jgi:hypothetical protein
VRAVAQLRDAVAQPAQARLGAFDRAEHDGPALLADGAVDVGRELRGEAARDGAAHVVVALGEDDAHLPGRGVLRGEHARGEIGGKHDGEEDLAAGDPLAGALFVHHAVERERPRREELLHDLVAEVQVLAARVGAVVEVDQRDGQLVQVPEGIPRRAQVDGGVERGHQRRAQHGGEQLGAAAKEGEVDDGDVADLRPESLHRTRSVIPLLPRLRKAIQENYA